MARGKSTGNGRLEEALATLIQNQAAFVTQMLETDRRIAEMERINSERFARIEAILAELTRMMRALPEAVREKIGFRVPEKPASAQ